MPGMVPQLTAEQGENRVMPVPWPHRRGQAQVWGTIVWKGKPAVVAAATLTTDRACLEPPCRDSIFIVPEKMWGCLLPLWKGGRAEPPFWKEQSLDCAVREEANCRNLRWRRTFL